MKSALLAGIVLGATALVAQPVSPAAPTPESVQQLVALMKVDRIREVMVAQIDRPISMAIQRALQGQEPSDDQKKEIDDLHAKIAAAVDGALSSSAINAAFAKIYAQTFTQDEINGLIAFYNTPAGRAYVDKEPQIMQQTDSAMQRMLRGKLAALQADIRGTIQDLAAASSGGVPAGLPQ